VVSFTTLPLYMQATSRSPKIMKIRMFATQDTAVLGTENIKGLNLSVVTALRVTECRYSISYVS
jgi:hypothetical protein